MKKIHIILFTACLILGSCGTEEETTLPPSNIVQTPEPDPEPETPAPTQYTLTVSAGDGGTVSTEGGTYDEGAEVTITASPDQDYLFSSWEGNSSEDNSITITINADITIQAIFEFDCNSRKIPLVDYSQPSYDTFHIIQSEQNFEIEYPIYNHVYNGYGSYAISLDYNRDGFIDYVFFENDYSSDDNRQYIQFYLGDCDGNLTKDEINSDKFLGLIHGRKVILGDFNGDSFPDIFFAGHGWDRPPFPGEYPILLFSSQNGVFTENRLYEYSAYHHGGASGDWDNDGDLDIILVTAGNDNSSDSFMHLVNDGSGNFSLNGELGEFKNNITNNFHNCELYDVNKDGYLDAIFMSRTANQTSLNNNRSNLGTVILFGNGDNFDGNIKDIPTVEGWESVYDADFIDIDGNGKEEIVINRVNSGHTGWYIQIVELIDGAYIDNTQKFIDTYYSEDRMWISYLEINDYDNDGVIEMRNNIPLELQLFLEETNRIQEDPYYMDEWELSNGRFIKVN